MELNALTGEIVDAAMKVHSAVGPGLLEHAYEVFLAAQLRRRSLDVKRQVAVSVTLASSSTSTRLISETGSCAW